MQMELPNAVQRHILLQLMSGNDVEIRLMDGEFKVIALRKKVQSFPATERMYRGNIKQSK